MPLLAFSLLLQTALAVPATTTTATLAAAPLAMTASSRPVTAEVAVTSRTFAAPATASEFGNVSDFGSLDLAALLDAKVETA